MVNVRRLPPSLVSVPSIGMGAREGGGIRGRDPYARRMLTQELGRERAVDAMEFEAARRHRDGEPLDLARGYL